MLLTLILLPFFSFIFLIVIPRRFLNLIKILSLCFSLFIFFYSILLFFLYNPYLRYNFEFLFSIVKLKNLKQKDFYFDEIQFSDLVSFFDGINYIIGIDAISLLFIILTTLLFPLCFLLN